MSTGGMLGMLLLAAALGAGVWITVGRDTLGLGLPLWITLLLLIPVLCAGILLSARRHR